MFTLEMLRLQFILEAVDPISLPIYKGSTFHGGFSNALETISPIWFRYFFPPKNNNGGDIPKPFTLLPPLDQQQNYQIGETFSCELTLFGEAIEHYAITQVTIEYLGGKLGLGYSRSKYKIKEITKSTFTTTNVDTQAITLSFITRIRLMHKNRLLKEAPEFSVFIEKLSSRLKTLQNFYSDKPLDNQLYEDLKQQSKEILLTQSNVYLDDWDRYSGRQKEWMKFGGLLGEVNFQGNLKPFIPCLQMGEWSHIGKQSSFGLGKYSIKYGDN